MDDWIFYGDDQKNYALNYQEYLQGQGKTVHAIYVGTPEDFYEGWAAMGTDEDGNMVPIDTVYIQVHGHPEYIESSNEDPIYADKLETKTIDTILLIACSTGNVDFSNNFASQLAMTQDVNQVIAPDGLGQRLVQNYGSSVYTSNISNIDRKGNGFTMYQKINNIIYITPNLTEDATPTLLTEILGKGKIYSFINQYYYHLRENETFMSMNQLLSRVVGQK